MADENNDKPKLTNGKYKIVSNGRFTRVFDPDGKEMMNVRAIRWQQTGHDQPIAEITIVGVEVEIEGDWTVTKQSESVYELDRRPVKANAN